ncbi:LacI family DNA-binding transcriptional regulator [Aurantimonas sp. Leaf443]|uniref:LacI family DNA-binding transcriptional regulator n=1 Tax=Aurantimonas sp. Leaf443 TaxID=1736378 RepID=UPI0006F62A5F|nr:LacI family DNA-binding transcriptional regulator [Aurantimonas sp. Leaf443]KQT84039.1 transcriptional regulator [Aurantimonas sp. Leaf443]
MRDVSRLAGVSTMTVSRVLADPSIVSQETRARVLAAVEQLGYVPDLVAGSLSSRRTNFVGLILPTLTNSNFGDTAQGLAETLGPAYQLLIGYTLYHLAEEERLVRALLSRRPEALVVAGSIHTGATRRMLTNARIPVVEIWDRPEPPLDRAVGFSNFEAGRAAARHLIGLGHRRIAAFGSVVGEDVADHRGEARLQGFAAALKDAGLSDALVLRLGHAPVSYEHGAAAMAALLDRAPDVEAVFAVSDASAFGAMMECRRRGIDVPGRVAVLGFGDFEIGRQSEPPISTVRVDAKAIGERTGRLLLDLFEGKSGAAVPVSQDIGVSVVARRTTIEAKAAPCAAAARQGDGDGR